MTDFYPLGLLGVTEQSTSAASLCFAVSYSSGAVLPPVSLCTTGSANGFILCDAPSRLTKPWIN